MCWKLRALPDGWMNLTGFSPVVLTQLCFPLHHWWSALLNHDVPTFCSWGPLCQISPSYSFLAIVLSHQGPPRSLCHPQEHTFWHFMPPCLILCFMFYCCMAFNVITTAQFYFPRGREFDLFWSQTLNSSQLWRSLDPNLQPMSRKVYKIVWWILWAMTLFMALSNCFFSLFPLPPCCLSF